MAWGLPDDWGSYSYTCERCGTRCHESEGCDVCSDEIDRAVWAIEAADTLQEVMDVIEEMGEILGEGRVVDAIPDALDPGDLDALAADGTEAIVWGADGCYEIVPVEALLDG